MKSLDLFTGNNKNQIYVGKGSFSSLGVLEACEQFIKNLNLKKSFVIFLEICSKSYILANSFWATLKSVLARYSVPLAFEEFIPSCSLKIM